MKTEATLAKGRISKTPGVCGGDACIRDTRIPVWVLAAYRQEGLTESTLLRNFPGLDVDDLTSAWKYAEENRGEIARAIAENAADSTWLISIRTKIFL